MNVGDLIDELTKYDRSHPVRLTVCAPPNCAWCEDCGKDVPVEDFTTETVEPIGVARGLVGQGKLVVFIKTSDPE